MSIARVTYVKRSRKPYKCEKCRTELPVGSAYRWFTVGFRSSYAHIRCMQSSCTPKNSELESSNLSQVYAAQEEAFDAIRGWSGDVDDLKSALESVADACEEVADQYDEADQNFGGGGNTEMGERAEALRDAANTMRDWTPDQDEPEACDEHDEVTDGCDDCEQNKNDWVEETMSSAEEAAQELGI